MNYRTTLAAIAFFGMTFSSSAHATNLVADGDFSIPSGGTYTTYTAGQSFGPWNVTSGSVDLIGNYWQTPSVGGGSVDMDGSSVGAINQSLNLNQGNYVLTFALSGNPQGGDPTKSLQASIGGTSNIFTYNTATNATNLGNMNYVQESMAFTVSGGPQTLSFTSLDLNPSAFGAVLGNVSISEVPLPPAALLFGAALLGLVSFGVYRRRQGV